LRKTVTLFFQSNINGLSLAASIRRLAEQLNFKLILSEGGDCVDFRIACAQSHAVIIDLSVEDDGINNYNLLTGEHGHIDHILVVSRTHLPINLKQIRTGGAPPYPFPDESIPGFSWTNSDIICWLREQLQVLLQIDRKNLVTLPKTDPNFPKAVLESLVLMSKESSLQQRQEAKQTTTIFISYRGKYYSEVKKLAERIRSGEWHPGKNPKVIVLTPGQLAFERELLTEIRRWQVLGMLEELVGNSSEFWIFETKDYLQSWWTIGELICLHYASYMWITDQRWLPAPKLRIYDPQNSILKDEIPSQYQLTFNAHNRAQFDRMMSIANREQIDLQKIKRTKTLAKIYPAFYYLGLAGVFTKPMKLLKRLQDHETLAHMPEEDQAGMAESQSRYIDYWADPKNLLFQMKNPLFKKVAWNKYSTTYHEQFWDNQKNQINLNLFFDCTNRMKSAVSIEELKSASSNNNTMEMQTSQFLDIIEHPPRWLWQGAGDEEAKIFKVPTYSVKSRK